METRIWLIVLILFISGRISANPVLNLQDWTYGEVNLINGEKIEGKVRFDEKIEIIKVKTANGIKAFSPVKVHSFRYFDRRVNKMGLWYSVETESSDNYKILKFYQLLHEGPISLFCRTKSILRETGMANEVNAANFTPVQQNFELMYEDEFYIWKDSKLISFSGDLSDLLSILGKKRDEIKDYIKSNNLDQRKKHHLIEIINYYNFLSADDA